MGSKRIDISLFDASLQTLINASAKIFPVNYDYVQLGTNPNNYDYVRCLDGVHKNEIYIWNEGVWQLIGADDKSIDWNDVQNKPGTFQPIIHTHLKSEITDFAHTHVLAISDVTLLQATLDGKALSTHIHGISDVTGLQIALDTKALNTHDHDGRYFTESEITTLLSGKAPSIHNHDIVYAVKSIEPTVSDHETRLSNIESGYSEGHFHNNITLLQTLTQVLVDGWNSAVTHISDVISHITGAERTLWNTVSSKADAGHNHDLSYSALTHIHDDRYYTESEITTLLSGKVDTSTFTGHTGNSTVHVLQTDKDTWNAKTKITQGTVQPSTDYWFKEV